MESISLVIGVDLFMSDFHNNTMQHYEEPPSTPLLSSSAGGSNSAGRHSSKLSFSLLQTPHTQYHTVAVMMPNSVYYPSVWMGISKSSEVLTIVSTAAAAPPSAGAQQHSSNVATTRCGHSCSAALLNTSISNNTMFSRSVASSGAQMIVIDAAYVHLLFADETDDELHHVDEPAGVKSAINKRKAPKPRSSVYSKQAHRHTVSVPPSVKKILLWHNDPVSLLVGGGDVLFGELPCGISVSHLQAIAEFNDDVCTAPRRKHRLYADAAEELACLWLSNMVVHSIFPAAAVQRSLSRNASAPSSAEGGSNQLGSVETPPLTSSAAGHLNSPGMKAFDLDGSFHNNATDLERSGTYAHPSSAASRQLRQQQTSNRAMFGPTAPLVGARNGGGVPVSSSSSLATTNNTSSTSGSSHGSSVNNGSNHSTPALRSLSSSMNNNNSHRPRNISPLQAVALLPGRVTASLPYDYADLILEHIGVTLTSSPRSFPSWRHMWATYRTIMHAYRATDPILKIFTSGTTGLPKAAKFTHLRFHMGLLLAGQVNVLGRTRRLFPREEDFEKATQVLTTYNTLPMYHSAGGVFCTSHLMFAMKTQLARPCRWGAVAPSARMIVRKKFSASNYAAELVTYRVHIAQYIGEILRYAVAATPASKKLEGEGERSPKAVAWRVPVAFGNGLRSDVWQDVLSVLPIASVIEFYASTEGNVGMINIYDEPNAVGHLPVFPWPFHPLSPIFWSMFPMKLVEYDPDEQMPRRYPHRHNLCQPSPIDSVGEMLGKVPHQGGFDPIGLRRFDGYHDSSETKKKLLSNVLTQGDLYFRSGDLLRVDRRGFVTFVDRIGDTFRWKGENVSTLEVANALNRVATCDVAVQDAVVYGVSVPGREGKAGMAKFSLLLRPSSRNTSNSSIVKDVASIERRFLRDDVYSLLSSKTNATSLPQYAIPVFLRVNSTVSVAADSPTSTSQGIETMTGTFKHRPVVLAAESYHAAFTNPHAAQTSKLSSPLQQREGVSGDRYYVLVPTRLVTTTTKPTASPLPLWTYVPLQEDLLQSALGASFEFSGW
ncbi:fatty acid transporter, putative [Bodo saltans]|uniref:Fatty acid transporter, putative n=1 Tax=Bodo saltans TaxID=75058 RepID=A0A0S4JYG2_BODSA|nr:fatty acid transporter, putative [Bodo saltans]|eukprot:CUG93641.1 fatty acid transporter, putative [Bodo saltans]